MRFMSYCGAKLRPNLWRKNRGMFNDVPSRFQLG